ncbi:LacI family DNA-binding transcriptional regulator [Mesorhizobium sp. NZP2298]|uniref:LacI family DNA-binding transcriptional regulator n=1 Tax=Mesorhizobium sp. NZP2298 TaxID=2483403 RepID=UPI001556DB29|nr:LacI family DNA-binding transcriptional regulator [Mesorhizobium sp. NZP2298]QKC93768.1 LacI family transcriptional regulator [Mesorhizobium sp. NZP2298]
MKQPNRRPNAVDVARLAGVSKSTVSRAFTEDSSINALKKQRIIEAARQLGYRPNAMARSLRTTRSNLVGILLEEFTNPIFLRILELITAKLQEHGLHAITVNASKDHSLSEAMELVMQYRIDGLIVSSDMPLKIEYECAQMNIPVVAFARSDRRIENTLSVSLDEFHAGRMAARHLLEQGYRAPAFIGGFPGVSVSLDRHAGFRDHLAEEGLRVVAVEYAGDNTYDRGLAAGKALLEGPTRPDSVFCVNDQVAVGVIDAARFLGLSVPEDLGVIGVDDIWMARTAQYDLTTVLQPLEAMADALIALLMGRETGTDQSTQFEGTLVPRGSTRRKA